MRRLIVNIYRIVFRISGNELLSLVCALMYIAVLNLVIIYGLSLLLEELFHGMTWVIKLFSFPYYLITAVVLMVLINFCLMLPLHKLVKDAKRHLSIIPLIIYTSTSVLLFLYVHFCSNLF